MKICFIADARSPIARNWIQGIVARGHDVHVLSSYPAKTDAIVGAKIYQVPFGFNRLARVGHDGRSSGAKRFAITTKLLAELRSGKMAELPNMVRGWLGPWELQRHVEPLRALIEKISPDFVHAMRLPFEGIAAAQAVHGIPLLISIWGNDLTLHAERYPLVAQLTRQALARTDALHCDCHRDLKLAKTWGFEAGKPSVVLPGGGGIQTGLFTSQGAAGVEIRKQLAIPDDAPVIINPRGFRAYVRNDTFFRAIPMVLQKHPRARFLALGMEGNPIALRWTADLRIHRSVRLLPVVSRERIAELFRASQIATSITEHDGTPNTLLEAMASGCFPIAGNIESVREWIRSGENGFLCDPASPEAVAEAICQAIREPALREQAAIANQQLVNQRAEHRSVMAAADAFYSDFVDSRALVAVGR